jgi:hypothetical protein
MQGNTTPPTALSSGNISSLVRTTTGTFTVNFTSAMPSSDYTVVVSTRSATATSGGLNHDCDDQTTTSFRLRIYIGTTLTTFGAGGLTDFVVFV